MYQEDGSDNNKKFNVMQYMTNINQATIKLLNVDDSATLCPQLLLIDLLLIAITQEVINNQGGWKASTYR